MRSRFSAAFPALCTILPFLVVALIAPRAVDAQRLAFDPGLQTVIAGQAYVTTSQIVSPANFTGPVGQFVLGTAAFSLAFDQYDNLYISDTGYYGGPPNVIRVLASGKGSIAALPSVPNPQAGYVYTVAGNGDPNFNVSPSCQTSTDALGDGCPATAAPLNGDVANVDSKGNILLASYNNNVVRIVYAGGSYPSLPSNPVVGNVYAVAGIQNIGNFGNGGDGGPANAPAAQFNGPVGAVADANGNIYVSDQDNQVVRIIYSKGPVPGLPANPAAGNLYTPAFVNLSLNNPGQLTLDASGNLYIANTNQSNGTDGVVYFGGSIPGVSNPVVGNYYQLGTSNSDFQIAVDAGGSAYNAPLIRDSSGGPVTYLGFRIDRAASTSTVFGNLVGATCSFATDGPTLGDGCPATEVSLGNYASGTGGIALDSSGSVYLADSLSGLSNGAALIRKSDVTTSVAQFTAPPGISAPVQTVTVYNTDATALQFSDITVNAPFSIVPTGGSTDCSASTSLPAAASCLIGLTFQLGAAGTATGKLSIASNSKNGTQGVNSVLLTGIAPKPPTSTTVSLAPPQANAGQTITLTATVLSSNLGNSNRPTGTVTFVANDPASTTLGTATVNASGVATTTATIHLAAGNYTVTAQYPGDASNGPSSGSAALTVTGLQAPVVTVTPSNTTASQGGSVTFTVKVTPFSGTITPTGMVSLLDNSVTLGSSVQLSGGSATFTTTALTLGENSIVASYSGDNNYASALSAPTIVQVQLPASTARAILIPGVLSGVSAPGAPAATDGFLLASNGVTTDVNGNIYYPYYNAVYVVASGRSPVAGVASPTAGTAYQVASLSVGVNGIAVDPSGNIYLACADSTIQRVDIATAAVTVVGGQSGVNGPPTYDGPATQTSLNNIGSAIAVDNAGNIYFADNGENYLAGMAGTTIDRIDAVSGVLTLAGGTPLVDGYSGDGGPGTIATFTEIQSLAIDSAGNLLIAQNYLGQDPLNPTAFAAIRKLNLHTGIVTTVVGQGCTAYGPTGDGGPALTACLTSSPTGSPGIQVVADAFGNFLINDGGIREVFANGTINAEGSIYVTQNGVIQLGNFAMDQLGNRYFVYSYYNSGEQLIDSELEMTSAGAAGLSFSGATLGAASTQSVTVTSDGLAPLTLTNFTFPAGFAQTPSGGSDCDAGQSLAPGTSCQIGVGFFPASSSTTVSGTITIADNSNNAVSGQNSIAVTATNLTTGTQPNSITFGTLPNVAYGVSPITLTATASSGEAVTFAASGPARISGSTLKITGAGKVAVTAYQFGDATYATAKAVTQTFTVAPAPLKVTANDISCTYGQVASCLANNPFTYTITGFINGDTQASSVAGSATLSTTANANSSPGTYSITFATEALTSNSYTFTYVPGTLNITGSTVQTITFGALPGTTYGTAPITLSATASSDLPVSFSVEGPATVVGNVLTITGAGAVAVTATQSGNVDYGAAQPVTQSFVVSPATLTVTADNQTVALGNGPPPLTYTFTGFVHGDTAASVSGSPALTTTATASSPLGNYPITVTQGTLSATNYGFKFVSGTLTVTSGTQQTISFNVPANATYGVGPIALSATASSGLPVTYSVSGPGQLVGTASTGVRLLIQGAGAITVTASQPGQGIFPAATPVSQTINVAPALLTFTVMNATRPDNTPNPAFTANVTGFVNGDSLGSVFGGLGFITFTTTALPGSPAGQYPITESFGTTTNPNYKFVAVNGVLTVTSGGPASDFSITANPVAVSMLQGQARQTTITLAPTNYFLGGVAVSCGNPPANVRCIFTPGAFNADGTGNPQSVTLTISTDSSTQIVGSLRDRHERRIQLATALGFPGLFAGLLLTLKRKRLRQAGGLQQWIVLFTLMAALAEISACGGSKSSSSSGAGLAKPGTYTLAINASGTPSDSSTPISHSVNLTITVEGPQ